MNKSEQYLSGKISLVTGSSSGIGLAIAEKLAEKGSHIILHGIENEAEMASLCIRMREEYHVEVMYFQADLSVPETITELAEEIKKNVGEIDILINNAGIQHVSPVEDFPDEKWDKIIALNLSSAFHLIKMVVPGMKKKGFGRIINIASAHGLVASPFKSAYVSAKHGIVGLTKCVALEVAQCNITVNAICPGYVLTPLVEHQIPATAKAKNMTEKEVIENVLLAAQPTRQFVTTEQIAATAAFLCTTDAASVTGSALTIDGGWTAH